MTLLGIVGGSSLLSCKSLPKVDTAVVTTPYGPVRVYSNSRIVFVQRHEDALTQAYVPAHKVNYKSIIWALDSLAVTRIVAFGSVGSLCSALKPGTVVIPDDFIDITPRGDVFSEDAHIVPGFCDSLRRGIITLISGMDVPLVSKEIVYVQTRGPRFETRAEIKAFRGMGGDVVGMTCATEATLAMELKMPYAVIGMVDNYANGVIPDTLSLESFKHAVEDNRDNIDSILAKVIDTFSQA